MQPPIAPHGKPMPPNFRRVYTGEGHGGLFVSGEPRSEHSEGIAEVGIKHVIDARRLDMTTRGAMQPNYFYLIRSDQQQEINQAKEVADLLTKGENVLVHCGIGQGISPVSAYITLRHLGLSHEKAQTAIQGAGGKLGDDFVVRTNSFGAYGKVLGHWK